MELGSDQSTGLKKGAKIDINDYMSLSNDFKMVKNPITGALISQAMKKSNDAPKPAPAPAPLPAPKPAPAPAPAPSQSHSSGFASPIEEIRQYKELMDQGIITPEEFEKKKKLIMGI